MADTMTMAADAVSLQAKMWRLRRAVLETITPEDMVAITRKLIEKACEGCKQAIKLVFGYFIGRPGAAPLGLMLEEESRPVGAAAGGADSKRGVTAPPQRPAVTPNAHPSSGGSAASSAPPAPAAPVLTPEMERF